MNILYFFHVFIIFKQLIYLLKNADINIILVELKQMNIMNMFQVFIFDIFRLLQILGTDIDPESPLIYFTAIVSPLSLWAHCLQTFYVTRNK